MKSVGIDIGTSSIKVAEVVATSKGLVLSKFFEQPIGQNPAFDPEIEILDFLKSLVPRYNPKQWRIVLGMKQEKVAVRNKVFPFNDRLKILKSLPFELEEDLPFSPENAIYDGKIAFTMGNSAEVLACASPKVRINEYVEKMKDVGLDISVLSPEGIAFANCLEKWNEPPQETSGTQLQVEGEIRQQRDIHIIANIGHTRTIVCAFDGLNIIGIRSILWGGKNIAEVIAKRYEISFIQAMAEMKNAFILVNQENANYDQVVFSDTISECVKELARELKITLLEFQSEFNGRLRHMSVTGGPSQIQNIHAFLTTQIEVAVNIFYPLNYFSTVAFEKTAYNQAVSGIAIGLAIDGLRKPRNPAINFLKGEFLKQNKELQRLWKEWQTVAKLGLSLLVIFTIYATIREQFVTTLAEGMDETLKKQAKEVARLPLKQQNANGIRTYVKDQRKKVQQIKTVQAVTKMNSALEVLRKISDNVPGKSNITLTVTRVNIQNTKVEIEGTVANASDLGPLKNSLIPLSTTGKVEDLPATPKPVPGTPFAFSFNIDRGIQAGAKK